MLSALSHASPSDNEISPSDGDIPALSDVEDHAAVSSDDESSDKPPSSACIDEYPFAGRGFGDGAHTLKKITLDEFVEERKANLYYPFANKDDWEVAEWLSMAEINNFLKLTFVRNNLPTATAFVLISF